MPKGRAISSKRQWRALWARAKRGEISERAVRRMVRESQPYRALAGTDEEHRKQAGLAAEATAHAIERAHEALRGTWHDCETSFPLVLAANVNAFAAGTEDAWGGRYYGVNIDENRMRLRALNAAFTKKCLR